MDLLCVRYAPKAERRYEMGRAMFPKHALMDQEGFPGAATSQP